MAQTKRPQTEQPVRPPPKATKSLSYEALAALNQHFEQVIRNLARLRELGLFDTRFRRASFKACKATNRRDPCWANFEVVEALHDREERDRPQFGRIRYRWEGALKILRMYSLKPSV